MTRREKVLFDTLWGVLGLICTLFLLLPRLGHGDSQVSPAKMDLAQLRSALEQYQLHQGKYPVSLEGLVTKPGAASHWQGPYLEGDLPRDPWGHPYRYLQPGKRNPGRYDVWSAGPDGEDDTEDDIYQ